MFLLQGQDKGQVNTDPQFRQGHHMGRQQGWTRFVDWPWVILRTIRKIAVRLVQVVHRCVVPMGVGGGGRGRIYRIYEYYVLIDSLKAEPFKVTCKQKLGIKNTC